MPSLFRQRDFVLLWAGQTVSDLGSSVTFVAFPLVAVVVLHASAFEVSMVTAAASAGWLMIGLPAGVWVDRLPRRPVLIGTDIGRALLISTVPLAWFLQALTIAQLVLVAFAVGLLSVVFDVGSPAFLPSVVARERLVDGNSALAASHSAANIVGPGLGGALVQLAGAPVAILVDAASFLVSAGTLIGIRAHGAPRADRPARQPLTREIAAGLRYVWSHPLTRTVAVSGTLANFVLGGYHAVIVFFLARQVGVTPAIIGVLFTLSAVGALAGSLAASPLAKRAGDARVMSGASVVMAVSGLLIPLTSNGIGIIWYVAGALPLSLGIAAFNVCVRAAIQTAAPDAMLGRVTATIRLFSRSALSTGALCAGALATALAPRTALMILMALLAITPVWLLLSPIGRVRDVTQLAPTPTAALPNARQHAGRCKIT